jgi:hypothetical protein
MDPSPGLLAKYANIFIIPFWTGLLMLPFTGPGNALRISAAAATAIVLWKLLQLDAVASLLRQFTGRFSRIGAASSSLVSSANTSIVLAILIVALIIVPLFLNDYYRDVLTLTGIYVVLALGLNVTVGQAGLLNLGYVALRSRSIHVCHPLHDTRLVFLARNDSRSVIGSSICLLPWLTYIEAAW